MNSQMTRSAVLSPDRVYRYELWRQWDDKLRRLLVIGLNPSTADETVDDPTIKKCVRYAQRWGFGALCMANLFAFRATQPKDMMAAGDPIGPDNDITLAALAGSMDTIVAAWGAHGNYRDRSLVVMRMFEGRTVCCLDIVKNGEPKHPLYCRDDQPLRGYRKGEIYLLQ